MRSESPRNALCAFRFYSVGVAISGGSFVVCVRNYLSMDSARVRRTIIYDIIRASETFKVDGFVVPYICSSTLNVLI